MKQARTEDPGVIRRVSPAANAGIPELVNGLGALARRQSDWDPYEVWRTRVKESSAVTPVCEGEPSR